MPATAAALTRNDLLRKISQVVGLAPEEISDREDLVRLGFGSLDLMTMVNEWRLLGVPISYSDLVAEPTVANWWHQLAEQRRRHPFLAL